MRALPLEICIRYRDFLATCNCPIYETDPHDWACYGNLWADYWTLADDRTKYKLLQFKGPSVYELVHEMRLLDPAKGEGLDNALTDIRNTLTKYPPDFDRNTVFSQMGKTANTVWGVGRRSGDLHDIHRNADAHVCNSIQVSVRRGCFKRKLY